MVESRNNLYEIYKDNATMMVLSNDDDPENFELSEKKYYIKESGEYDWVKIREITSEWAISIWEVCPKCSEKVYGTLLPLWYPKSVSFQIQNLDQNQQKMAKCGKGHDGAYYFQQLRG